MVTLNLINESGGPHELQVKGNNTIVLQNVMMDEVWICSGQSNMDGPLSVYNNYNPEVEAADVRDIRILDFTDTNKWAECTPITAKDFSTTGFFFGRELYRDLHVPIGLIESAVGATNVERWMNPSSIEADSILSKGDKLFGDPVGDLYNQFIAPIIPFAIRGVIWYQGKKMQG